MGIFSKLLTSLSRSNSQDNLINKMPSDPDWNETEKELKGREEITNLKKQAVNIDTSGYQSEPKYFEDNSALEHTINTDIDLFKTPESTSELMRTKLNQTASIFTESQESSLNYVSNQAMKLDNYQNSEGDISLHNKEIDMKNSQLTNLNAVNSSIYKKSENINSKIINDLDDVNNSLKNFTQADPEENNIYDQLILDNQQLEFLDESSANDTYDVEHEDNDNYEEDEDFEDESEEDSYSSDGDLDMKDFLKSNSLIENPESSLLDNTIIRIQQEKIPDIYQKQTEEKRKRLNGAITSGEEFEKEKNHLSETQKHIHNSYRQELLKEFKKSTIADHIMWRKQINSGTVAQSEYYEEKRDNWISDTFEDWKKRPYTLSMKLIDGSENGSTVYYIGKRDAYHYIGSKDKKQIVFNENSVIGERYLEFNSLPDKSGEEYADISEIRLYSIQNGRLSNYSISFSGSDNGKPIERDPMLDQIEFNRQNNDAHDIFFSIRHTQTEIIKTSIEIPSYVYGCAGSGKTILLLYQISRANYRSKHFKDEYKQPLNLNNIALITPTDLLKQFNDTVIKERGIEGMVQATPHELIRDALEEYYSDLNVSIKDDLSLSIHSKNEQIKQEYSQQTADLIFNSVFQLLNDEDGILTLYIDKLNHLIQSLEMNIILFCGADPDVFSKQNEILFHNALNQFNKLNDKNFTSLTVSLTSGIKKLENNKTSVEQFFKLFDGFLFNEAPSKKFDFKYAKLNLEEYSNLMRISSYFSDLLDEYEQYQKQAKRKKLEILSIQDYLKEQNHEIADISYPQFLKLLALPGQINRKVKEMGNHKVLLQWIRKKELSVLKTHPGISKPSFEDVEPIVHLYSLLGADEKIKEKDNPIHNIFPKMEEIGIFVKHKDLRTVLMAIRTSATKDDNFPTLISFAVRKELAPDKLFDYPYQIDSWVEAIYHLYIHEKLGISLKTTRNLYSDGFNSEPYYLFFDEIQDLSLLELECLEKIYPNHVSHYMGDPLQCINPKGLATFEEFEKLKQTDTQKCFDLDVNYRNAEDITNFVNKICNMNMKPIGLSGKAENIESFLDLKGKLISNRKGDIAIIVKDKENLTDTIRAELLKLERYEIYHGIDTLNSVSDVCPIVYSVADVKGLEFETAIVFSENMSNNEIYVSCTRALKNLYFLKSKEGSDLAL